MRDNNLHQMNNTGPVRRADLYLRAEYPEFETTIYRIEQNRFLIYIENLKKDFDVINVQFEKKLKPLLTRAKLTKKKPKIFLEIIPSMSDSEISKGLEGILMTKSEWINLLAIKFPTINFYKITDDTGVINIHIANYRIKEGDTTKYVFLDKSSRRLLEDFIYQYKSPMGFNIVIDEFEDKPALIPGYQKDDDFAFVYVKNLVSKPFFTQRDESLWYDNVDHIFQGSFKKKDLFFFNENEYNCYVDFSVFPNVDLRYHLLLYQVIYLTPPLEKRIDIWLKTMRITRNEFIELIVRERIKLVLTQDNARYDLNFMNEIYELMPNSIVSKRAVSCLQQCDIIELSDNYIFNTTECIQELKYVCEISSKFAKVDSKFIYDIAVWPIKARRNSFEILQRSGIMSASLYGVNMIIDNPPSKNISEAGDFLLKVYSPSIHLAHALNATYFPFQGEGGYTDGDYADMMGKLLNFFKFSTLHNFKEFTDTETFLQKGNNFISPINLIMVNDFDSILDFEDILNKELAFPNGRRLIETLSSLSPKEQSEKIAYYNEEIMRFLKKKDMFGKTLDFSVQSLNAMLGFSTGLPTGPVLTAIKLGGNKFFKHFSPIRHIMEKIEQAMESNIDRKNIHFLSKINRAVKLKN